VRAAVFTTSDWAGDAARLASNYDVALVLLDAPPALGAAALPEELQALLERSPADVAFLAGPPVDWSQGAGVFVPFGGGVHDWAALELAAWLAAAASLPLTLVGTKADVPRGRRDASVLLADAALAVQRVLGVRSQPLLADPTDEALVAALGAATLVVQGISPRWRRDGVGSARRSILADGRAPMLVVHGGLRPGGLAPAESETRFTWSIQLQPA
jgi:hypothetical protein